MHENDLLKDPVLSGTSSHGPVRLSLPGLLEALGSGEPVTLSGLQRHQSDPVHVFLCYLAGAVLQRASRDETAQDEAFWRTGLVSLAAEQTTHPEAAWQLIVEDPTRPAFLQAPSPSREDFTAHFKLKAFAPDSVDVLQTAKNHDVKTARATKASAEDWVYALITSQTTSGYMGRGNYGVARMNSGQGSRVVVACNTPADRARRLREDVKRLLAHRPALLAGGWNYDAHGIVLTWPVPWDRVQQLSLSSLDPFFIEVSRALRLVATADGVVALGATSEKTRIAANEHKGVVGDPWIPVRVSDQEQKALTVPAAGFTPRLLRDVILGEGYRQAAMQRMPNEVSSSGVIFHASVLVGGQGKTDGFHSVDIPIPVKAATILSRGGLQRDVLLQMSEHGLGAAKDLQNKVLKPAVLSYLQGGVGIGEVKWDAREQTAWWEMILREYSRSWEAAFFPWLWGCVDSEDKSDLRVRWLRTLADMGREQLKRAISTLPRRTGRRYRAASIAESVYGSALYRNFPDLKEGSSE